MKVEINEDMFDPWRELAAYQQQRAELHKAAGATAVFVGTMRDFNDGNTVHSMVLEHYPAMTQQYLQRMVEQSMTASELLDVLVLHRVGKIFPGQPIVLVATWSAHRAVALTACRDIMEQLKAKAPFWKQEMTVDGTRWVEHNTPG